MPSKKNDTNPLTPDDAIERYLENDQQIFDDALDNDSIFHTISKVEVILTLSKMNSISPSLNLSSKELEEFQASLNLK